MQDKLTLLEIILKIQLFQAIFLFCHHRSLDILLVAFYSLPNEGSKLVIGGGPNIPIPAHLEALLGRGEAVQLHLHSREQKIVGWGKIL
jgi:hypothetical protein